MRKYSLKQIGLPIFALLLLMNVNRSTVYAAAVPDIQKEGSVTVIMQDPETELTVPGGTMTLYPVGDVYEDDGNFSFVLNDKFADSRESLDSLDADLAQRLAVYAGKHGLRGMTSGIGSNGSVEYSNVRPGLYLLVQEQAADGYYVVNPFLVSIPLLENGSYLYDVDATPKMEIMNRKPDSPGIGPAPDPSDHSGGYIPETGDTGNPTVWLVLMVIGAFCCAGTLIVKIGRRHM